MESALARLAFWALISEMRKQISQPQSAFFKTLPRPIRLAIYELALSDEARDPGIEVLHVLKLIDNDPSYAPDTTLRSTLVRRITAGKSLGLYGALLSCHQMHTEVRQVLYSKTTFHLASFSRLTAFTVLLPRPSLALITTLTLDLRLKVHDSDPYYISATDSRLVLPSSSSSSSSSSSNPSASAALATPLLTRFVPRHGTVLALHKLLAARFPKLEGLTVRVFRGQGGAGVVSEVMEGEVFAPFYRVKNKRLKRVLVVVDWRPGTVSLGTEYEAKRGAKIVFVRGEE